MIYIPPSIYSIYQTGNEEFRTLVQDNLLTQVSYIVFLCSKKLEPHFGHGYKLDPHCPRIGYAICCRVSLVLPHYSSHYSSLTQTMEVHHASQIRPQLPLLSALTRYCVVFPIITTRCYSESFSFSPDFSSSCDS